MFKPPFFASCALSLGVGLGACTSSPPDVAARALASEPIVVVREVISEVPEGGDGPDTVLLAIVDGEGEHPIDDPAWAGVRFWDGALVLRPDRELWYAPDHLCRSQLDTAVATAPVVSADGEHAAWAAMRGEESALVVLARDGTRYESTERIGSIGALSFDESRSGNARRIAMIGARNGGIAGVWVARVDGTVLRCVTNCELRAGRPLGETHVPLPDELVRFEGDSIVYRTGDRTRRFTLPEVLR